MENLKFRSLAARCKAIRRRLRPRGRARCRVNRSPSRKDSFLRRVSAGHADKSRRKWRDGVLGPRMASSWRDLRSRERERVELRSLCATLGTGGRGRPRSLDSRPTHDPTGERAPSPACRFNIARHGQHTHLTSRRCRPRHGSLIRGPISMPTFAVSRTGARMA